MKIKTEDGKYVDYVECPEMEYKVKQLKFLLSQKMTFDPPSSYIQVDGSNVFSPLNNFSVTQSETGDAFVLEELPNQSLVDKRTTEYVYRISILETDIEKYLNNPYLIDKLKKDVLDDFHKRVDHSGVLVGPTYLTAIIPGYENEIHFKKHTTIVAKDNTYEDIFTGKYELRLYADLTNI